MVACTTRADLFVWVEQKRARWTTTTATRYVWMTDINLLKRSCFFRNASECFCVQFQGRVRKRHPRMFYLCLTHGALIREKDGIPFEWCSRRVAVISAKNHERQRRKRQSVTAKRKKSQTPKVLTATLTLPNLF